MGMFTHRCIRDASLLLTVYDFLTRNFEGLQCVFSQASDDDGVAF